MFHHGELRYGTMRLIDFSFCAATEREIITVCATSARFTTLSSERTWKSIKRETYVLRDENIITVASCVSVSRKFCSSSTGPTYEGYTLHHAVFLLAVVVLQRRRPTCLADEASSGTERFRYAEVLSRVNFNGEEASGIFDRRSATMTSARICTLMSCRQAPSVSQETSERMFKAPTACFMWLLHQSESTQYGSEHALCTHSRVRLSAAVRCLVRFFFVFDFSHIGVERVETVAGQACTVNCSFHLSSKKKKKKNLPSHAQIDQSSWQEESMNPHIVRGILAKSVFAQMRVAPFVAWRPRSEP